MSSDATARAASAVDDVAAACADLSQSLDGLLAAPPEELEALWESRAAAHRAAHRAVVDAMSRVERRRREGHAFTAEEQQRLDAALAQLRQVGDACTRLSRSVAGQLAETARQLDLLRRGGRALRGYARRARG